MFIRSITIERFMVLEIFYITKMLSVRIVCIDHYMSAPIYGLDATYSEFRGSESKQVPIIRIFGSTSTGQKTCLHVHGVFPYIYIPFEGSDDPNRVVYQVASSLDKAINISLGQGASSAQHVYKVLLVKGIPFYGYHRKDHKFLKVYLYNPNLVKRAADLLNGGAILGRSYQPHEAHLSFTLQFLMDYNLYGMNAVHLQRVMFRQGPVETAFNNSEPSNEVLPELLLLRNVPRMSTCSLEVDCLAVHILNRLEVASTELSVNPGLAAIWEDEKKRRRNQNKSSQIEQPPSQPRPNVKPTSSDMHFKEQLRQKLIMQKELKISQKSDDSVASSPDVSTSGMNYATLKNDPEMQIKSGLTKHRKIVGFNPNSSVYPIESDADSILDASSIQNHGPNNAFENRLSMPNVGELDKTMNESIVDEELIALLTQYSESSQEKMLSNEQLLLDPEDIKMLNILKNLEENSLVEDDSILGSQQVKVIDGVEQEVDSNESTEGDPDLSVAFQIEDSETTDRQKESPNKLPEDLDSDENDDLWEGSFCLSNISQLDGADDTFTPNKSLGKALANATRSPKRAPKNTPTRTPKNSNYAPLDILIKKSPCTILSDRLLDVQRKSLAVEKSLNGVPKQNENSMTREKITIDKNIACYDISSDEEVAPPLKRLKKESSRISNSQPTSSSTLFLSKHKLVPCSEVKRYETRSRARLKRNIATNKLDPQWQKDFGCDLKINLERLNLSKCKHIKLVEDIKPLSSSNMTFCPDDVKKKLTFESAISYNNDVLNTCTSYRACSYQNKGNKADVIIRLNEKSDTTIRDSSDLNPSRTDSIVCDDSFSDSNLSKIEEINSVVDQKSPDLSAENASKDIVEVLSNVSERVDVNVTFDNSVLENSSTTDKEKSFLNESQLQGFTVSLATAELLDERNDPETSSYVAKEYDSKNNYVPQAGTSKHSISPPLTPSLDPSVCRSDINNCSETLSSELVLSQNKICKKDFEHNLTRTAKNNPPTRGEVLDSLEKYEIPDVCHPQPFYSKSSDVTNKKQVGHVVLKIPGKALNDLPDFPKTVDYCGIDEMRERIGNRCIGNKPCTITLVRKPPTVKEVKLWLRAREMLKINKKSNKAEPIFKPAKLKIMIPNSPDQDNMDSSFSNSMTISPCTPIQERLIDCCSPEVVSSKSFKKLFEPPITPRSSIESINENEGIEIKGMEMRNEKEEIVTGNDCDTLIVSPVLRLSQSRRRRRPKRTLRLALEKSFSEGLNYPASNRASGEEYSNKLEMFENKGDNRSNLMSVNESPEYASEVCSISETKADIISSKQENTIDVNNSLASESDETVRRLLDQSSFVRGLQSDGSDSNLSSSVVTGVTLDNTNGFRLAYENLQDAKAFCENQYLTLLTMEVHTQTRGDLRPDPDIDPIRAVFYSINDDVPENYHLPSSESGVILVDFGNKSPTKQTSPILKGVSVSCAIKYTSTETELISEVLKLVQKWDPDILAGYEIEMLSWGYLIQRAFVLEINLVQQLSRVPSFKVKAKLNNDTEQRKESDFDDLSIPGRIVLDVWRLMKHEVTLTSYTFENVMYHVLHQRIALHSFKDLTHWWEHRTCLYRWITIEYYLLRVQGIIKLLDQLDLIGRTSELARLFGIQFFEVLSRGSQFRVESMMLRLAKPLNFVPVSPAVQQRARMRAPESLPLILEPESRYYSDPVIVLDFQSLYPSIMIAYNYCFSTCLGRVEHLGTSNVFEFGATQLKVPVRTLEYLLGADQVTVSPCGVAFVKTGVRRGVLPRMLEEILSTRLMVKQSMKENKDSKLLQRVLHSRQLGLKLIANVTYGYTAANFSGRMPCVEVGDSVVSKGRETLERAIKLVEATPKWRAKVVYGDTDSLFVLVPGRSREKAFEIGAEIADAVTNDNPIPVKLKLEKVYHPCILQTKKRYVGYMYESPGQAEGQYEAKGIETVRRDGCPVVGKMLEKCLRLLFETQDVSAVKEYVCRQFTKILGGRSSLQDLIFAREFRGATGYKPGACVPALELTKKWRQLDKRAEPRRGERVPYVIVNGPPGVPLIRLVRSPYEVLADPGLRPNALYYITRVIIPPINRCFSLIGADLHSWFAELPRKNMQCLPTLSYVNASKKSTISQYFSTVSCAACGNQAQHGLCDTCLSVPQTSVARLFTRLRTWERKVYQLNKLCQSCCGRPQDTHCLSLDCPVLFRLTQAHRDNMQAPFVRNLVDECFENQF